MLSTHAEMRMAQRGIKSAALDLVLSYGGIAQAQGNCEEYALSARAARQIKNTGYDRKMITAATKVRAIVGPDGTVVTCYHQQARGSRPTNLKSHFSGAKYA